MDKKRINKTNIFKIVAAILGIVILVGVAMRESNRNKVEAPDAEPEVTTVITTPVTTLVSTSVSTTTENTTTENTSAIASETTTEITTEETTTTEIATDAPVIEVVPETEAPKVEEVVDTEPIAEVQPLETEKQEEYLVYKESTHYIHKNTCRWNKGDAYRVYDVTGLEARLCSECNPVCEGYVEYIPPEPVKPDKNNMTYLGCYSGTYYPATAYYDGVCGGSTRTLLGYGDYGDNIRGSIASRSLYEMYGYNRNGRTTVYLEFPEFPEMDGLFFVDDCSAYYGIIDVFVWSDAACPFGVKGRTPIDCYIE